MPRQANGTYTAPANTAAVSGQAISSTAFNTLETDIGNEITNSLDRQGRSAMQAALPMGSNKITGMADPTVSTDAATKNYVDTTTAAFFSTGDIKLTLKTAADSGWILFDDGTFGSATSGSSNRANADTQSLFTLFFNNMTDTAAPILTSGGGATTRAAQVSAAAAWAANCRMTLQKTLGRALAIAGTGSGLSARPLGSAVGEETHTLVAGEIPSITSQATGGNVVINGGGGTQIPVASGGNLTSANITPSGSTTVPAIALSGSWSAPSSLSGVVNSTSTNALGGAHNTMQPTTFLNAMVKL